MSKQDQIKKILEAIELPNREIKIYGSQITIECVSRSTCEKWSGIVKKFAKVRKIIESFSYTKQNYKQSVLQQSIKVYRLYAVI